MKPFKTHRFTLGGILRTGGILSLVCIIVFYVHFQARNIIQGPTIALTDTLETIQHGRIITLHGNAHNVVKITVNGKEIHTDETGTFSHTLVLENNYTILSIDAQDRFGRKTTLSKEFIYVPS